MCGIVGAISSSPIDPRVLDRMRDDLAHRGPDHAASWVSSDGSVGLGHRRLAVIDPLPEANQPFASHDGRFLLVYNGELYNYRALKTELETHGVRFRTRSDSEVLLEAYRRWGEGALARFSGMFAFAIWDQAERTLFCARDRAGEKPLYYAALAGAFLFASEPKVFSSWPMFARRIHYPALLDYLAYGFVPDPKCIWEHCAKLPPGHCMTVRTGTRGRPVIQEPHPWWDWSFDPEPNEPDWTRRVLDTLTGAAREMTIADVPLGVFLSGGVDSSSVVAALAQGGGGERIKTFTIGFDDAACDERHWARAVAARYGTEHHERLLEPQDAEAALHQLMWHFDEPFGDHSFLPTYYLAAETRREVTVALSGDGADEIFAGYRRYSRAMRRVGVRRFLPDRLLARVALAADRRLHPDGRVRRLSAKYGYDAAAMVTGIFTHGLANSALAAHARGPLAAELQHYDPREVISRLLQRAPPERVGLVNTLRYIDFKHTLPGDILVKVDRACMAVALEVRPVYLHRDMLRLAGAIPGAQLAGPAHTKETLKVAVGGWLPAGNIRRGKQGFLAPLNRWLRESDGGEWTRSAGSVLPELLDPALLAGLTQELRNEPAAKPRGVHQLLLLDHWLARWSPAG
ncbi:MAG: asparagine synthase (glutamine-hydrolyzing) [Gemmatimonadales bacterium]